MRIKFQVITVSMILVFTSCKSDKGTKNSSSISKKDTKKEVVEDPYFYVTLKAKFFELDKWEMFYLSGHSDNYKAEKRIITELIPNGNFQEILFELKEEVYPYNIRLDFGTNKKQPPILIEYCILHYGNEVFKIDGKDLTKYFHFNEGIKINSDSLTFTLKTFKRGEKDIYDPFIMGNEKLSTILGTKL